MNDKKHVEMKDDYQHGYSKICLEMFNLRSRTLKSKKIYAVCKHFSKTSKRDLRDLICLEIGCSAGIITRSLSKHFKMGIGCDIDHDAIHSASVTESNNALFAVADALNMPFKDQSIDVIICNHVYEHVPDSNKMVKEIYRILKDDGFCYFAAANKYMLIEGHYYLPFLSWLPKPIANLYLRITGKGQEYYEMLLSYFGLCKLLKDFGMHDYTIQIIRNPKKFMATDKINENSILTKIPDFILNLLKPLVPTFIFILTKKGRGKE